MLNHIYGIIGIVGTLVTIITSYIKNQDTSQWILVCSGWLAALVIGWFTHRTLISISQHHQNTNIDNNKLLSKASEENKELNEKYNNLNEELIQTIAKKENFENIAAYLSTQNIEIKAMPRIIKKHDETESGDA